MIVMWMMMGLPKKEPTENSIIVCVPRAIR
jgi:hypothetical protein